MKKITAIIAAGAIVLTAAGCKSDAEQASENLSKKADEFEVARRIVFVNGITDEYIMEMTGLCSIQPDPGESQLEVTCRADSDEDGFVKHFFGLSDNTFYLVQQISPVNVSTDQPILVLKPQSVIPTDVVGLP